MRRRPRARSTTLPLHRSALSFIRPLAITDRDSGSTVRIGSTADTAIGVLVITGANRRGGRRVLKLRFGAAPEPARGQR
jgi:hypothetical protein